MRNTENLRGSLDDGEEQSGDTLEHVVANSTLRESLLKLLTHNPCPTTDPRTVSRGTPKLKENRVKRLREAQSRAEELKEDRKRAILVAADALEQRDEEVNPWMEDRLGEWNRVVDERYKWLDKYERRGEI
ncbi:hypothetical protein FA13DRAFT_24530 [Coprinellus micaceus]|uniref:Uncharacterized protein n=1 Tax=Coprinellus micaceus TaxID=71717 RepID=A0A4Y7U033_COPMI|nr:hypothetical protein FA13DRAFT_24530 [Coprinellus micaceus]